MAPRTSTSTATGTAARSFDPVAHRPAGVRRLGRVLPPGMGAVPARRDRHGGRRVRDGAPPHRCSAPGTCCGPIRCGRPTRTTTRTAPASRCAGSMRWSSPTGIRTWTRCGPRALEVEWWRVHRMHQHADDVTEDDLTAALVDLYAYVYQVPDATVRDRRPAADGGDGLLRPLGRRRVRSRRPAARSGAAAAGGVVHRAAGRDRSGVTSRVDRLSGTIRACEPGVSIRTRRPGRRSGRDATAVTDPRCAPAPSQRRI